MIEVFALESKPRTATAIKFVPEQAKEYLDAGWIDAIDNSFGENVGVVRRVVPGDPNDEYDFGTSYDLKIRRGQWIVRTDTGIEIPSGAQVDETWEPVDVTEETGYEADPDLVVGEDTDQGESADEEETVEGPAPEYGRGAYSEPKPPAEPVEEPEAGPESVPEDGPVDEAGLDDDSGVDADDADDSSELDEDESADGE